MANRNEKTKKIAIKNGGKIMAFYWRVRGLTAIHRNHVANRLLALRAALRKEVTKKKNVGELKIATWNLMHFGGTGGYRRSAESLQYIAEIIDHFDLVSIQEVKPDLTQLKSLLNDYLGDAWDYITSDVTQGDAGNDERMAVLYRKERVTFSRVAGEIVLPPIKSPEGVNHPRQFARTPYFLGFQADWFKFKLCSVHIHYGAKGGEDKRIRIEEIKRLAMQLTERSTKERKAEIKILRAKKYDETPSAANYVLLGDFNIHNARDDESLKALTGNGFAVPDEIKGLSTNTGKDEEPFDQIAFRLEDKRFVQVAGGVFDYRKLVYRPEDSEFYRTLRTKSNKWPAGLEKLKAQEEELKKKAAKLPAEAKRLTERAKKLTEQAKQLAAQLKRKDFLDNYLAEGIKDYFVNYYRKNQISDHLLLWTSFKIDYADDYLTKLELDES